MKKTKVLIAVLGVALMSLAMPAVSLAGESMPQNIYIPAGQDVETNFIAAGQSIDLGGNFKKDVYVFGNMVNVTGNIDGDLIVFGSYVRISGNVAGNVRGGASSFEIDGKVGKNATVAAGIIFVKENAEIGWDLMAAGGLVNVNGPVKGTLSVAAGSLEINSAIDQGVRASIDKEGQFILHSSANVKGGITYSAPNELISEDGAIVEGEVVKKVNVAAVSAEKSRNNFWGKKIFSFAALLLIGLLLMAVFGKFGERVAAKAMERFGVSLGLGFLALILMPVAFVILLITIIGAPLAVVSLVLFLVMLYVSKVFAGLFVGSLLLKYLFKKKKIDRYLGFLIGLVVLSVIGLIPFVGGMVWVVLVLVGLGAFILAIKDSSKS
ncbi:MAG TPA: hypothetical protein VMX18_02315 [Candidatus Bipolaricaulota bacterium]|nr:hypothetical protein [Candidatus Bipolaricaulota bacterium]